MRLLLIHSHPLTSLGGAELNLGTLLADAPEGIDVKVALPDDPADLESCDILILANLRPEGGLGEKEEYRWAELWSKRIRYYRGYVIKAELDIHPCAHRDGRCIQTNPLKRSVCDCGPRITKAFEKLYNLCDAIQFLSPLHREAINLLVEINFPKQYEIASPIDLDRFQSVVPFAKRKNAALICGDAIRVGQEAAGLAEKEGYPVEYIEYLSVPYADMPELLNQYKAVVIAPAMLHAFGRLAVEALACGCHVITNGRVGAMSWPDPIAASRKANADFWSMITHCSQDRNPLRFKKWAFWRH